MNVAQSIEPNVGETIIWRHSSGRLISVKRMSETQIKQMNWAFRIIGFCWMVYWVFRPSTVEQTQSVQSLFTILIGIFLGFLIGVLMPIMIGSHIEKSNRERELLGLPIWMSEQRLVYSSGAGSLERDLNLTDIQTIAQDYVMGSPALILISAGKTLKLMSSEVSQLRDKLFTLRPDLKLPS